MDAAVWLDEVPTVRAHTLPPTDTSPGPRAPKPEGVDDGPAE